MPDGYWCLVLHNHLPYVRHPEYDEFLEEDWFFEAMTETYLPILAMMENFQSDGTDFRITMSLTPPLCNMMSDTLLQDRYHRRLSRLIELAQKEVWRLHNQEPFHTSAKMYFDRFIQCMTLFERNGRNILKAYRALQDSGKLEIITCNATHGFLPLMSSDRARRAQVRMAVRDYRAKFGRDPRGIWLAECAYAPGVDRILRECGIRYFFLEAHGLLYGEPRPRYGVFAPVYTPEGVAVFSRDMETAQQVWSAETGYPGDPDYREFYRDVGYDLDLEYIKPYLHPDGVRRNVGIKYHRVTGKVALGDKQPYVREWALNKAASHAGNFLFNREHQIRYLRTILDREPLVVSMYDAELFGHWWFEGPDFLNFLFRKVHYDQNVFQPITPSEYLERYPRCQVQQPAASSWGDKGYYEVWLNGTNDWIYRHVHRCETLMCGAVDDYHRETGAAPLVVRVLNQMARELLLAQSSDWAFIMTTGTMVEYARKRTGEHVNNFLTLHAQLRDNRVDRGLLEWLESKNNIFPDMDYTIYR
jgi:1,4-alpha-glucan branching enzyme